MHPSPSFSHRGAIFYIDKQLKHCLEDDKFKTRVQKGPDEPALQK